jgi:hypothetical protein
MTGTRDSAGCSIEFDMHKVSRLDQSNRFIATTASATTVCHSSVRAHRPFFIRRQLNNLPDPSRRPSISDSLLAQRDGQDVLCARPVSPFLKGMPTQLG